MKTCVTHHHACDCREEKFRKMEASLAEARKGLEFYADEDAWSEADCQRCPAMLLGEDIENRTDNKDRFTSGKTARITLSDIDAILSEDEREVEEKKVEVTEQQVRDALHMARMERHPGSETISDALVRELGLKD